MPTKTVLEPSNTTITTKTRIGERIAHQNGIGTLSNPTITTKARIGERIDHHNPTIKEEKQKGTLQ